MFCAPAEIERMDTQNDVFFKCISLKEIWLPYFGYLFVKFEGASPPRIPWEVSLGYSKCATKKNNGPGSKPWKLWWWSSLKISSEEDVKMPIPMYVSWPSQQIYKWSFSQRVYPWKLEIVFWGDWDLTILTFLLGPFGTFQAQTLELWGGKRWIISYTGIFRNW